MYPWFQSRDLVAGVCDPSSKWPFVLGSRLSSEILQQEVFYRPRSFYLQEGSERVFFLA
jgi:hypothetical protein